MFRSFGEITERRSAGCHLRHRAVLLQHEFMQLQVERRQETRVAKPPAGTRWWGL